MRFNGVCFYENAPDNQKAYAQNLRRKGHNFGNRRGLALNQYANLVRIKKRLKNKKSIRYYLCKINKDF